MSPVGDAYWKKGLASASDRVRMCQLAADTSRFVMVRMEFTEGLHDGPLTALSWLAREHGQTGFACSQRTKGGLRVNNVSNQAFLLTGCAIKIEIKISRPRVSYHVKFWCQVDPWEAMQRRYLRTLHVLRRIATELDAQLDDQEQHPMQAHSAGVREDFEVFRFFAIVPSREPARKPGSHLAGISLRLRDCVHRCHPALCAGC